MDKPNFPFPLRSGVAGGSHRLPGSSGKLGPLLERLLVAGGLVGLGCLAFLVDVPVAEWCRRHRPPGELGRLVDLGEVFGHGLGAAVILGIAVALDPLLRRAAGVAAARWDVARLFVATYAGGLVVDVLKLLVTRVRPRAVDFAIVGSAFDTFGTGVWARLGEGTAAAVKYGKVTDLMSFPSGHAAVAAGLATALAWKYPHGMPVFACLAAVSATQRLLSSAHYPSDVLFGAACGVAAAAVCLGLSRPSGATVAA
jgi:membrane-associated phospholipid phosphatase